MPKKGYKQAPEHRAKISVGLANNKNTWGHALSPQHKTKISAALRGRKREPFSAEHRAKLSVAAKGRRCGPLAAEHRAKISSANLGKEKSLAHCANLSAALKGNKHCLGRKYTPETRAKISVACKGKCAGPRHPMWLGGISRLPYAWDFNDELKEEVRRRDGYKCQLCGAPQVECRTKLPVHHIDYDKKNSDPVNLTALCNACNAKVNTNRQHWAVFFRAMAIQRDVAELSEKGD